MTASPITRGREARATTSMQVTSRMTLVLVLALSMPLHTLTCPVPSVQYSALTTNKCAFAALASADEYEEGDNEDNDDDDKEMCGTPAPLGGASKRASTGPAPVPKRSSNLLF